MQKKKILVTFQVTQKAYEAAGEGFELICPVGSRFTREEILAKLPQMDGVLVGMDRVDRAFIDAGSKLKVIGRHGVGCDSVDCEYAGKKGIYVVNTPAAVQEPTSELAITLMLCAARYVAVCDRKLRETGRCSYYPPLDAPEYGATTVSGKTAGVVGLGRIGKCFARKAVGLGMKVVYSDIVRAPREFEARYALEYLPLEELLRVSDVVSLHCPYIPENHHLINARTLALMKPTAYLINASRGKMVNEQDLADALKNKVIKGAALDVYEFEPEICRDLLNMDNVVLAPHIGTGTYEASENMALESLQGIIAVLNGEIPPNVFNLASVAR